MPTADPKKDNARPPETDEDDDNGADLARLFQAIDEEDEEQRKSSE